MITRILTLDNEICAIIAVVEVLGVYPVTCNFHVQQSMIRNFAKPYGLKIDKGGHPFVDSFNLDLKSLILLVLLKLRLWS